jgi:hypothetical protein
VFVVAVVGGWMLFAKSTSLRRRGLAKIFLSERFELALRLRLAIDPIERELVRPRRNAIAPSPRCSIGTYLQSEQEVTMYP